MLMTSPFRKFMLTAHIIFSVGWLGAVVVFLAHAIVGVTSQDALLVRTAYLAMDLSAWFVIIPACFGALITGVIQSLGTKWGLFRHYWIAVKLLLTIAATILLLLHMQPISYLAGIAAEKALLNTDYRGMRIELIVEAAGGLLVLLTATIISVSKPWGKIQYKLGSKQEQHPGSKDGSSAAQKSWGLFLLIGLIVLALLIVILHLFGGGMGSHH